jgi:hypothetical protein
MPSVDNWPPVPERKPVMTFAKELSLIIFALIEAAKEKSQEIFKDISK